MGIIIAIPIYRAAKFFLKTAISLKQLYPQPQHYVFCENNSPDNTLKLVTNLFPRQKLIRLWFQDRALDKLETAFDLIAIIRQTLLTRLRQLDPDYAVFLDSDVLPLQHDLLTRLTRNVGVGRDIVGGFYVRPYPQGWFAAALWKSPLEGKFKLRSHASKKFGQVEAVGGGCMCISRRVLQDRTLNFYPIDIPNSSEDYGYCLKAKQRGYKVWLDASIKLKHYVTQEHVDGKAWRLGEDGKRLPFSY